MVFRNKSILGFPKHWLLHFCWKACVHQVKLPAKVFTSLGKTKGRSLNTNMDCGYKKSVTGQVETSGRF